MLFTRASRLTPIALTAVVTAMKYAAEDHRVDRAVMRIACAAHELEPVRDLRQRGLQRERDRRERDDEACEIGPSDHPAEERTADQLRPLIRAPGQGIAGRELREDERDEKLSSQYDRPAPDEAGSAGAEAQI